MTRNKVRIVKLKPPSQEQLNMPGTSTEYIKLTNRENNEVHFRANQTTQLKKTHRLGAVVQVESEENSLVQFPFGGWCLLFHWKSQRVMTPRRHQG